MLQGILICPSPIALSCPRPRGVVVVPEPSLTHFPDDARLCAKVSASSCCTAASSGAILLRYSSRRIASSQCAGQQPGAQVRHNREQQRRELPNELPDSLRNRELQQRPNKKKKAAFLDWGKGSGHAQSTGLSIPNPRVGGSSPCSATLQRARRLSLLADSYPRNGHRPPAERYRRIRSHSALTPAVSGSLWPGHST